MEGSLGGAPRGRSLATTSAAEAAPAGEELSDLKKQARHAYYVSSILTTSRPYLRRLVHTYYEERSDLKKPDPNTQQPAPHPPTQRLTSLCYLSAPFQARALSMKARERAKANLRASQGDPSGLSPDAVTPTGVSPGMSPASAAGDLEISRAARTPHSALEVRSMQT